MPLADTISLAARTYYWKPMAAYFRSRELAEYCSVDLKIDGRTLDLGCGEGGVNEMLKELDIAKESAHGIDIAYRNLTAAKSRRIFSSISQADANQLPFSDESFETVICNGVLCSIPEGVDQALDEINRVLVKDGKLVVTVPTDQFVEVLILPKILERIAPPLADLYLRKLNKRLPHFTTYTDAEWQRSIARHGFDIRATRSFFTEKDGWVWNLMSLQVFRVFGLLKLIDSETIRRTMSRALTRLIRQVPTNAATGGEKFGYLFIVANKS